MDEVSKNQLQFSARFAADPTIDTAVDVFAKSVDLKLGRVENSQSLVDVVDLHYGAKIQDGLLILTENAARKDLDWYLAFFFILWMIMLTCWISPIIEVNQTTTKETECDSSYVYWCWCGLALHIIISITVEISYASVIQKHVIPLGFQFLYALANLPLKILPFLWSFNAAAAWCKKDAKSGSLLWDLLPFLIYTALIMCWFLSAFIRVVCKHKFYKKKIFQEDLEDQCIIDYFVIMFACTGSVWWPYLKHDRPRKVYWEIYIFWVIWLLFLIYFAVTNTFTNLKKVYENPSLNWSRKVPPQAIPVITDIVLISVSIHQHFMSGRAVYPTPQKPSKAPTYIDIQHDQSQVKSAKCCHQPLPYFYIDKAILNLEKQYTKDYKIWCGILYTIMVLYLSLQILTAMVFDLAAWDLAAWSFIGGIAALLIIMHAIEWWQLITIAKSLTILPQSLTQWNATLAFAAIQGIIDKLTPFIVLTAFPLVSREIDPNMEFRQKLRMWTLASYLIFTILQMLIALANTIRIHCYQYDLRYKQLPKIWEFVYIFQALDMTSLERILQPYLAEFMKDQHLILRMFQRRMLQIAPCLAFIAMYLVNYRPLPVIFSLILQAALWVAGAFLLYQLCGGFAGLLPTRPRKPVAEPHQEDPAEDGEALD